MAGSFLESLLRGGAQGATADFGDEGSAKVYSALNNVLGGPKDPEGIGRDYASGSAEQDYLQKQRRDDSASAKEHPVAYGAGSLVGSLPATMALPVGGGGSAAARVAASGLTGGALGALTGAGSSNGKNVAREAAKGAGLGGALGVGGGAALEAIPMLRNVFRSLPKTAEAAATGSVTESGAINGLPEHQVQLNYNMDRPAIPPKRADSSGGSWSMPEIPKAGKPGLRPSQIPAMEAEVDLAADPKSLRDRALIDRSFSKAGKPIDRDVEYLKNMADQKEAGVAKRAAAEAPKTESELKATVKPPKKGGRAPAKAESPTQTELPFPEKVEPKHWLDEDKLEQLHTGRVAEPGFNASEIRSYKTPEGTKTAVYKPTEGQASFPMLGIKSETMPLREEAAHKLSKVLNPEAPVVPKTVARDGGSLQEFVPHAPSFAKMDEAGEIVNPAKYANDPSLKQTLLLDLLSRNPDRHGGNALVTGTTTHAIDNGLAFGGGGNSNAPMRVPFESPEFETALAEAPMSQDLNKVSGKGVYDALKGLPENQVRDVLGRLRDLQFNPGQLKGLSPEEIAKWAAMTPEQRALSGVDLAQLDMLMGRQPNISKAARQPLPGKALEGEQLKLR